MSFVNKVLFSCFLLISFNSTPSAGQTLIKKTIQVEQQKSLLWKIEGKDLKAPSYLFGTIHLIPRSKFLFNNSMNQALSNSENVVFEIDMNVMNDFTQMFGILSKIRMPDGVTIKDLLSPEDYKLFTDKFAEQGLPTAFLEGIKPMFLSAMGGDAGMGGDGDMVSYEVELSEKAKEQGKKIGGLETIDEQLAVIDSISLKDQAAMLVESLKSTDASSGYDEMVKRYLEQDVEGLNTYINDSPEAKDKDMMNSLLSTRNKKWIPAMEKTMVENPTFFAVGAGHLGGKEGVINLLREAGYKVSAVVEM